MSSPSQTAAPPSNFKSMLDAALAKYKEKTGDDLLAHRLATDLQTCESVDAVLDILRDQAQSFERSGDQKLMKWIDPLVHVLYTFSGALGDGVSLAFPPAKVIFTGIGVLLAAAKDARASHGAIIDLFERIESFFKRLEVYTQISLTTKMAEVLVKIVIELLSILSIATKEVKRRRAKFFARKLLGMTDIEDALRRLDSLIQEEVQMAIAQILKVTTEFKEGADKTNMVMQVISNSMEEVKRDVGGVKNDVEEVKWTQIEQEIHKWFSPPDPSTNYNIGCKAHYEGTATWFFQGKKFEDWTSIGSLLWIHGKPGSGKSVLCSAIIKHVMSLRDAGQASLAYFYFDFRDKDKKQDLRNFITSLLVQLSAYSNPCCKIISRIYSTHGKGTQQPSDDALMDCLREMISVTTLQPVYIVIDALDECPDSSGMPTPREVVLNLLEDLVRLGLPNLHICVTSRPEIDIKIILGPLTSAVSLHDEIGQMKDIFDYVTSVVYSDRKMRSWRDEEKELVVEELSNKADGMFRWVFCQLEVLRHCFPANIRQTLRELPETLDETYARVLRDINKAHRAHAHRMMQCLVVAVRPLRVEELAELLAFEFDAAPGGIPKYRATWRLDDQTQAVLSTCSSLVTVIDEPWDHYYGYGRRVVQFSHFSVKEFLMSDRLTSPLGDFSRYHIYPRPAHTILTQACLGLLLHMGDHIDKRSVNSFPLAEYAAQHWVEHAQSGDVTSPVKDAMETLFDSDKPHFATWVGIYDIDMPYAWPRTGMVPNPLYHSALCGFYDLVKHLAIKHPQHVNAVCGQYGFPLLAALSNDHVRVAELLLEHGANVDVREKTGKTMLLNVLSLDPAWHPASYNVVNIVKFLLKHGTDVNAQDNALKSPLHLAEYRGRLEVAQMLLEHKADVNSRDNDGKTPLHTLSKRQIYLEIYGDGDGSVLNHARLLLEYGAEVNIRDKDNQTPLHLAIGGDLFQLARILLEHGADTKAENDDSKTPLHLLSESRIHDGDAFDLIWLLLEHGAEVNRRDTNNQTPLHLAIGGHSFQLACILLEHGADSNAENNDGKTPLHLLSGSRIHDEGHAIDILWLLLEHGAEVNRRDQSHKTPLLLAMGRDRFKLALVLLEHGADANAEDNNGKTPLHILSERRIYDRSNIGDVPDHTGLWLKHGAEVDGRYKNSKNSLLLDIDAFAENNTSETSVHQLSRGQGAPWHWQPVVIEDQLDPPWEVQDEVHIMSELDSESNFGPVEFAEPPLDRMDTNTWNDGSGTSLYRELEGTHVQSKIPLTLLSTARSYRTWSLNVVRVPLDRDATANSEAEDNFGCTPLHPVGEGVYSFEQDRVRVAQLLLERGADVNATDGDNISPLHLASYYGRVEIVRVLLDGGATTNSKGNQGRTPLHAAAEGGGYYSEDIDDVLVAQLLLERGADVNMPDVDNQTPLHLASYFWRVEMVLALLNAGANASVKNVKGQTPLHLVSQCPPSSRGDAVGVAQLLLEHGADVNAQDTNHATPSDPASYHGRTEIASLFGHQQNDMLLAALDPVPLLSCPTCFTKDVL